MTSNLWPWTFVALVGYILYDHFIRRPSRRLPPGPTPLPIVGNVLDLPPAGVPEYRHWLQHKDKYGGISSVTVLGRTLIIMHDKKAAYEIMEKKSVKTAGRPEMIFVGQMCGYEQTTLLKGHNAAFRRDRKMMHREIGTKAASVKFQHHQDKEINRQLVRVLKDPSKWIEQFSITTGATILKIAYGYNVERGKVDLLVHAVDTAMEQFSKASVPMAWSVDALPFFRYLPDYFPGTGFKNTAREWKSSLYQTVYTPYRFVRQQMAKGSNVDCYVSRLVEQCASKEGGSSELSPEEEQSIVWTASTMYAAATDTTAVALNGFNLAMVMFPEVQRKAQEEMDRVVGSDRLPTFEDREKLPFVDAMVKEVLRWWPVGGVGFPHVAEEDIEYNGYVIPKGAYLLPAIWWFMHDPEVYPNPDIFEPERFITPRSAPDPAVEIFGYGRRVCPGRFIADQGLFLNIARSLAVFNITKATDKDGKEIPINVDSKPGVINYPTDYKYEIKPRSQKHIDLIKKIEAEDPVVPGDSEYLELSDSPSWR